MINGIATYDASARRMGVLRERAAHALCAAAEMFRRRGRLAKESRARPEVPRTAAWDDHYLCAPLFRPGATKTQEKKS